MSRAVRQQMLSMTGMLEKANRALKDAVSRQAVNEEGILQLLMDCQETAIMMGTELENIYGEGTDSVEKLEDYCESLYETTLVIKHPIKRKEMQKTLANHLRQIRRALSEQIEDRLEVVFLPYKASMWDSLESVWMAANEDEDCDAYVVPIPYYDKNPDGSVREVHYEIDDFPSYVPVTDYEDYDLSKRYPDIIFIHNPYDNYNYVTSVGPKFYSGELRKYTDCLVYIPYYSTSGGMSEAQATCPAYYNADYIVIQSPKLRKFFDAALPEKKFLPFGSPKFDRIVRMCSEPKQLPEAWEDKARGKKLYFYNTSIGGMLQNTEKFLKKMEYVFRCFEGREDACIVWRPHPLLESTFQSMREEYYPFYTELKRVFVENGLGIYDDTPDITPTIALCDAYIGDAGTSVTSLFGIVGKPMFILNNNIHTKPGEDDWRGEIIKGYYPDGNDEWMVTQGNHLYHSPDHDYKYEYYCDLSEYAYGYYYLKAICINGKVYVCPANAQDILIVGDRKVEKRICLEHCMEQAGAFAEAFHIGDVIYLIPSKYPAIVKYDAVSGKVEYIRGYNDVFTGNVNGEWRIGGGCVWKDSLLLASPVDNQVLEINHNSGEIRLLTVNTDRQQGCSVIVSDGTDVWMLPYSGDVIVRWNPDTEDVQEYSGVPDGFSCRNKISGELCMDRPFGRPAFCSKYVYLPPYWGNMYVRLNQETGQMDEWKPPFPVPEKEKNEYYYVTGTKSYFVYPEAAAGDGSYRLFSVYDRKLYDVNLSTGEYQEIPIEFNPEDIRAHEPGFCENSDWLIYACQENAVNTLDRFLDDDMIGNAFDKDRQISAYGSIAANYDGTSGEKVYQFLKSRI